MPIRIAIVGFGKIAGDQHLPAIEGDGRFKLVAVASRNLPADLSVPGCRDIGELVAAMKGEVDAVAICTPPSVRHAIAAQALDAGLDVMLEKPPAATLGEIDDLATRAKDAGRVLFAAWHSQAAAGVEAARGALAGHRVTGLRIEWHEDVRKWHPGQDWIWEPSGFGVFDPGINALSICTRILPQPLFVSAATLFVPANKQAPIAADVAFAGADGAMSASLDWRRTQGEHWTVRVETDGGPTVLLSQGGAKLEVDGAAQDLPEQGEYPGLYARFAQLVGRRESAVDREPLRIVADAFLVARREAVEPFI